MNTHTQGIYQKFEVARVDGRHAPGEKHHGCEHFVLDLTHDEHAIPAIAAYAASCRASFPQLAADLRDKTAAVIAASNEFVTVPETVLPNGTVVPAFAVGKYLCSKGPLDLVRVTALAAPWVRINYHDARAACAGAGMALITELQYLALACNVAGQAINWSGGAVGEGVVFQGLHKDTVDEAQHGDFVSDDKDERRWHELSNGQRIFDLAGNAFSWVFDDVQGDADGVVAAAFAEDSPSICAAPYPSLTHGMGWRPVAGYNGSGRALVRGGYWGDGDNAGVFGLGGGSPGLRVGRVGFRCTKEV